MLTLYSFSTAKGNVDIRYNPDCLTDYKYNVYTNDAGCMCFRSLIEAEAEAKTRRELVLKVFG